MSTTELPHMRCWRLDAAPASYRLKVGTICRFIDGKPPSDCTYDTETSNWVDLVWTRVPDPRGTDGAA